MIDLKYMNPKWGINYQPHWTFSLIIFCIHANKYLQHWGSPVCHEPEIFTSHDRENDGSQDNMLCLLSIISGEVQLQREGQGPHLP